MIRFPNFLFYYSCFSLRRRTVPIVIKREKKYTEKHLREISACLIQSFLELSEQGAREQRTLLPSPEAHLLM